MTLNQAIEFTTQKLKQGYTSDGCTFAPDFWIRDACVVHDVLLQFNPVSSFRADWIYFLLMLKKGFVLAPLYYAAVTLRTIVVDT